MLGHRAICEWPICYSPAISVVPRVYSPPSRIVAHHVINQAIAVAPGASGSWPFYVGRLPDGANVEHDCCCAYDTVGIKDGRLLRTGLPIWHYGVQVMVRSREYTDGWEQAQKIEEVLRKTYKAVVTISGRDFWIQNISQTSPILPLGQEKSTKRRELFALNLIVTMKET